MDKQKLLTAVGKSKNIAEVIENLEKSISGGSYKTVHKYIKTYNIDTTHFDPRHRHKKSKITKTIDLKEILVKDGMWKIKNQSIKERLIENHLKNDVCEECGQGNVFNGKPLVLQLDHINGCNRDNRIENLKILCPNCHTQTRTWGFKKRL